ncbi:MAG: PP2C family protein-serine/threonine phosphatase, partial [Bacteroidota bacterium]
LDENRHALVMADVSGKGIPAALLVSTLHASLRAYIQSYTDLGKLVQKLNKVVYDNTTPERFITCFVAVLDSSNHRLTYVNAGHNPPYIFHQDADDVPELGPSGLPLGMIGDATYEVRTAELRPNDVLALYTDGITEAMNRSSDLYSEERFQRCVVRSKGSAAQRIKTDLLGDVHDFVDGEPQSDDLTLLIAKRTSS